jgi:hypothetical protein
MNGNESSNIKNLPPEVEEILSSVAPPSYFTFGKSTGIISDAPVLQHVVREPLRYADCTVELCVVDQVARRTPPIVPVKDAIQSVRICGSSLKSTLP